MAEIGKPERETPLVVPAPEKQPRREVVPGPKREREPVPA